MFTPEALRELHGRTHAGTIRLFEHCRQLSEEERRRELPGFGYPSVQQQLGHIVSAEEYWVMVLQDRYTAEMAGAAEEEEGAAYPTIDALEEYRARTAAVTADYLGNTAAAELNREREFMTWPSNRRVLVPAFVVLRVTTHAFHHRGQVAAMSRILGYPPPPSPALDFPVVP
jgi:uncharacterized damage-inducible protein DinB